VTTHIASPGGSGSTTWLAWLPGTAIGVIGIALACWQHVVSRRDHKSDREEDRDLWLKSEENREKIAKREAWRPEYEDIRKLLDRAQKCYFSIRDHGPYTSAGFGKLEVQTICLDCETLAKRVAASLSDGLIQLKRKFELLEQNAISDETNPVREDLGRTKLQERAARDLDEQITSLWHVLNEEWGSLPAVRLDQSTEEPHDIFVVRAP